MATPGSTKISSSTQQTPPTNRNTSSQPAVPFEKAIPKEQQEANAGDESAEANSRRLQFRVQRGHADQQQQPADARRCQLIDQIVGPTRLDQFRIRLQSVKFLERAEVAGQMTCQADLVRLDAAKFERTTTARQFFSLHPFARIGQ